jgi:hypothetical protein
LPWFCLHLNIICTHTTWLPLRLTHGFLSVVGHNRDVTGRSLILTYALGTSDFDAQICGIKFWNGDGNLRPVYKNRFPNY